jgi:hypothetical protein
MGYYTAIIYLGKSLMLAFIIQILVVIIVDGYGGQLGIACEAQPGDIFNANDTVLWLKQLATIASLGLVLQGILVAFVRIFRPEQKTDVREI